MNDKFLSLLGLSRKAGKLSLGHDAVINSIVKNKAQLCILSCDASPRLQKEIAHACTFENKNIPVIVTEYTLIDLSMSVGSKAAVISVDDEGFASSLREKYNK